MVEREEILEAAEKEIQAQKTMAIETEQKMMDDFEWKLREIESDYRDKIKAIEDGVGVKIKAACDEIVSKKDEEFTRMSISMRREMDDKIRIERNALKTALETQNNAQRDKAIELYRLKKDHEQNLPETMYFKDSCVSKLGSDFDVENIVFEEDVFPKPFAINIETSELENPSSFQLLEKEIGSSHAKFLCTPKIEGKNCSNPENLKYSYKSVQKLSTNIEEMLG